MNSRKKGFSLVTVLFLIVGISITLGSVAFNFVTEGKLQRSDTNNNNSLSAAEIGLETAKMWLTDKVNNSVIPTETTNIKSDQGAPYYCLKGFNVSNLDVIDSKNEKLESIINKNTNFYKNSSFEYFIEDISVTYASSLSNENKNSNHVYSVNPSKNLILVYDKMSGFPSSDHPSIVYQGKSLSGYEKPLDNYGSIFIDENYLYLLNNNKKVILVYDKYSGQVSSNHANILFEGKNEAGLYKTFNDDTGNFFIDGNHLYLASPKTNHVFVYNKYTFERSADHPSIIYQGKTYSGYIMPLTDWTWTKGSSYIFIDENHLYMTGFDNQVLVFDKFTGQPSRDHPKSPINMDSLKRLYDSDLSGISTASADSRPYIFINGNDLYSIAPSIDMIFVHNKLTGQPPVNHEQITYYGKKYGGYILRPLGNEINQVFIDGDHLYLDNNDGYILALKKINGRKSEDHPVVYFNGNSYGGFLDAIDDTFDSIFVDNSDVDETYNYYKVYSCGISTNNSIKRIESIIAINKSTKIVEQISWKEIF